VSVSRFSNLPQRCLTGGRVVFLATTPVARARGLARLDALDPAAGLHIPACRSVHTFGMRFALDLLWLDAAGAVVRIDRDVPPRRLRMCWRAASVVEVAAGQADAFVEAGL
jgi:uncharacterized membrane protein (UPF0127 family)